MPFHIFQVLEASKKYRFCLSDIKVFSKRLPTLCASIFDCDALQADEVSTCNGVFDEKILGAVAKSLSVAPARAQKITDEEMIAAMVEFEAAHPTQLQGVASSSDAVTVPVSDHDELLTSLFSSSSASSSSSSLSSSSSFSASSPGLALMQAVASISDAVTLRVPARDHHDDESSTSSSSSPSTPSFIHPTS